MVERSKLIKDENYLDRIIRIANEALKGIISLDDFYLLWPEDFAGNAFFERVYDDIEALIEHTPGGLWSDKILSEEVLRMQEAKFVKVDLIIIKHIKSLTSPDKLIELREKLLKSDLAVERLKEELG